MTRPPTLRIYRAPGGYRWARRDPDGRLTCAPGVHRFKAAAWRAARRDNPDHDRCAVVDVTFTWTRIRGGGGHHSGPGNLTRPPIPYTPGAHRRALSIAHARLRL